VIQLDVALAIALDDKPIKRYEQWNTQDCHYHPEHDLEKHELQSKPKLRNNQERKLDSLS